MAQTEVEARHIMHLKPAKHAAEVHFECGCIAMAMIVTDRENFDRLALVFHTFAISGQHMAEHWSERGQTEIKAALYAGA